MRGGLQVSRRAELPSGAAWVVFLALHHPHRRHTPGPSPHTLPPPTPNHTPGRSTMRGPGC